MPQVTKSVLVPYSAEDMFALVADVGSYPAFLPWCSGTSIASRTDNSMDATIGIRYRGLEQSFTTHNTLVPGERIDMELKDGPFSELIGHWRFLALSPSASKVELELRYAFSNFLLERLVGPVFHHIANSFVDSFSRRAETLYGAGRS